MLLDRIFFPFRTIIHVAVLSAVQILFFALFLQVVSNTQNCSHGEGCAHDRSQRIAVAPGSLVLAAEAAFITNAGPITEV